MRFGLCCVKYLIQKYDHGDKVQNSMAFDRHTDSSTLTTLANLFFKM